MKIFKKKKRNSVEDYHISLRSLFYVSKMYRNAIGVVYYFQALYRVYNSVSPSITAVLSGLVVTELAKSISTGDILPVLPPFIGIFVINLVDIILSEVSSRLSAASTQDVIIYVDRAVGVKYLDIPLSIRESREFADKFERVKSFSNSIQLVSYNLVSAISAAISVLSVLIATISVSPLIALIVIVSAIPISILNVRLSARQRRNWRHWTKDRRLAWDIENKIIDPKSSLDIELNGLAKVLIDRMVQLRRRSQAQDVKDIQEFFWPNLIARSVDHVVTFAVLAYVAFKIFVGQLAIGQFLTIRNLFSQLNGNINSFFNNLASLTETMVNATDFMEFMEMPPRPNGDIVIKDTPSIEFKNVSFRYPQAPTQALTGVSFKIEPGEKVAIVGENGAGKTTIIKLILGVYQADSGEVLINGHPLQEIERQSYLKQIGALFQEYTRYDFATIGENVWFGDTNQRYDEKKIMDVLEDVNMTSVVKTMPKKLKQLLSNNLDQNQRVDLSGGQWQRLSIARAFFRSPNILILDEPTSAIDAKSEHEIFQNIAKRQSGKSSIIISHRFSTVRRAEHIMVLDHGKIVEYGTHAELMEQNGLYKEMFSLQAKGYK
jgi:ATP-binding cassette subfamily B protein